MAPRKKYYIPAPWDDDLPEVDPNDEFDAEPEEDDSKENMIEERGIEADDNLYH